MNERETIIKAGKSVLGYWSDVWAHRELFWILAKRDIMVRYKQSVLGVSWSVIRPLLTTLVMVFAFGKIANLQQNSAIPYMLIVGEKEAENGEVSVRRQGEGDKGTMKYEEFAKILNEEVQNMINKW